MKVILVNAGTNKLNVVKEVKDLFQLSLVESKDLVDAAPSVLATGIASEEADRIKSALENAGGTVQVEEQ